MVSNVFSGCIVLLATNLSLLYASHLTVMRFYREAPAGPRLVALGVLYYACIIALFQLLSPFYAITKTWMTIVCLLIALITHLRWGGLSAVRAEILSVVAWVKMAQIKVVSAYRVLRVCCCIVSFPCFADAASCLGLLNLSPNLCRAVDTKRYPVYFSCPGSNRRQCLLSH